MAWGYVAVAGATIGAAYLSNKGSEKAAKVGKEASEAELSFAKEQYQDWLDAFGDIQSNLSDYYDTITPAQLETQALQAFEQEKAMALEQLNISLEQRGIATSGLAAELDKDIALQSASERAKIRAEAPMRAAQQKREFLQIGLGQNPSGNVQQVLSNQAVRAGNTANIAAQAAGESTQAAVETTFDSLSAILANKDNAGND